MQYQVDMNGLLRPNRHAVFENVIGFLSIFKELKMLLCSGCFTDPASRRCFTNLMHGIIILTPEQLQRGLKLHCEVGIYWDGVLQNLRRGSSPRYNVLAGLGRRGSIDTEHKSNYGAESSSSSIRHNNRLVCAATSWLVDLNILTNKMPFYSYFLFGVEVEVFEYRFPV